MAIFFQNKDLSCPKCGNTGLAERAINLYSFIDNSDKTETIPICNQIYCPKCDTIVKEVKL